MKNSALVVVLCLGTYTISIAQIVYTDVNPNQVVSNGNFAIDMDNDGTVDFTIKQTNGIGVEIDLPAGNGVVIPPNPPGFADVLSCQTSVGSSSNFYVAGGSVPMYAYGVGYWSNATDKSLGVKFTSGASTYYGWIRLDVNASGSTAVIKDYAYNSQSGQSINTCYMGSQAGIQDETIREEKFKVYPTVFDTYITIESSASAKCSIYNYMGTLVKEAPVFYPKTSLGLMDLNAGMYFVTLVDQSGNESVFRIIKE